MPKVFFIFHFTVHAKIACELISLRSLIRTIHTAHCNGVLKKRRQGICKMTQCAQEHPVMSTDTIFCLFSNTATLHHPQRCILLCKPILPLLSLVPRFPLPSPSIILPLTTNQIQREAGPMTSAPPTNKRASGSSPCAGPAIRPHWLSVDAAMRKGLHALPSATQFRSRCQGWSEPVYRYPRQINHLHRAETEFLVTEQ